MQKGLHWSKVFTARLSSDVKLVGSTISCETAYMGGDPSNEARHNAHVQSYVIATDQVLCAACTAVLPHCSCPRNARSHSGTGLSSCLPLNTQLQQCIPAGVLPCLLHRLDSAGNQVTAEPAGHALAHENAYASSVCSSRRGPFSARTLTKTQERSSLLGESIAPAAGVGQVCKGC